MIEIYDPCEFVNCPIWRDDVIEVEFTFRNGRTKTITFDVTKLPPEDIFELRNKLFGKRKLLQAIFEHNTHGQITIQGITVRADDLISMEII